MKPLKLRAPVSLVPAVALAALTLLTSSLAFAQPDPLPPADPAPSPSTPTPPADPAPPPEPQVVPYTPTPAPPGEATLPPPEAEVEPEMSEGRRIVVAWNTGFQWGLSPGVFFRDGKAGFALAVRLGYGIDTGSVIVVPGVRLAGYFSEPNTYLGMPMMKLVLPIDRFAPFVEGGAGLGFVSSTDTQKEHTGLALMVGGGFMVHFTMRFGLGVEANYQVITGSDFKGFGVGPILALAF